MLFNSTGFALFLPIVFLLYWFFTNKSLQLQNLLLLAAGYFFYGCWDWRFLFLLAGSTLLDYFTGIRIHRSQTRFSKKSWLLVSVFVNLGLLSVFKYYDFFVTSFANTISFLGLKADPTLLGVVLPVGISFYTFHGLSYIIDIYKNKIKPENNLLNYAVFVSFFPLLVAGPIERATHLLPQIIKKRVFSYAKAVDGLKQILWGLFKKIVIADQCAIYVNMIFAEQAGYSGSTNVLGALLFSFQIYCDFSGYTDIALGTARLFGIDLLQNFSYPYFSRNIAAFWRHWHMSLSGWFRDYVYIPFGGSKKGRLKTVRNITIVFFLSGLWHGANITFIAWGLLHALFILAGMLFKFNSSRQVITGKDISTLKDLPGMVFTFMLTTFAWIFFRANSLQHAGSFISGIFKATFFSVPEVMPVYVIILLSIFLSIEWLGRRQNYAIACVAPGWPKPVKITAYYVLVAAILYFAGPAQKFIYFQF